MDDLIKDFTAETREMLEALAGEIIAWEAAPSDRARLDEIFRFVHTVKGNSGFFDVPRIRALSHAAEDALAEVRSGARTPDAALVSAILAIIDRIGELAEALETGAPPTSEDDAPLLAALSETAEAEVRIAAAPAALRASRTTRLPVELLDRVMSGVSDLVLARNELSRRLRLGTAGVDAETAFERLSACVADLRDAVTRTRMQRIETLFAPIPRMIRDLCAETGKSVSLRIEGADVEIDREMIEMIRDPLTHIVRNAVDHGVEAPQERAWAGKPESGILTVRATQAGNQILLDISDDGRGIDGDRLVSKALAAGLVSDIQAERLTDAQKTALIFEAGLSTAAAVTELSGRGVGMDVVRANIERIGGTVEVNSRAGEGVCIRLRVPLTLTILPALTVSAAGQVYAVPRAAIEEIVRAKGGEAKVERVGSASVVTIRGRRVPLVHLRAALGLPAAPEADSRILVLMKPSGGDPFALAVDDVVDHEELVVKPAAPPIMAAGIYAGTTIADDGKPVLLLDAPGLAAKAGICVQRRFEVSPAAPTAPDRERPASLLFRTLIGGLRLAPVAAVHRIDEVHPESVTLSAGRLYVTVGDLIFPLEGCAGRIPETGFRLLRLRDGASEIAYGFAEVVEIMPLPDGVIGAAEAGEVAGIVLIGGEPAELLDLHWLFSKQGAGAPSQQERPVCLLPGGDPFMDAILKPLVESAGYRTVQSEAECLKAPDVAIVSAEAETELPRAGAARLVRVRSSAKPSGPADESIHRYDRKALLAALAGRSTRRGRRNG